MLETSVNTWLYSSCCHCPFWFPLVFFPWDQGDLFLVQGLVKWGVAIVTDSWYKLSPNAIPGAGKGTFPEMGQQLGVPRRCSAQGTLKTAQDSQGDAQCIWNSPEAAWVPAVGTHTSCCLCWPSKNAGVGVQLCNGPLLQISCTNTSTKKSLCFWMVIKTRTILCLHWELSMGKDVQLQYFATSAFLAAEQLSITEMLVGKVWRPFLLCPTQNRSGINQDQVNHGFD